jgi:hypothetical protein
MSTDTTQSIVEALPKLIQTLTPLTPEDRQKAIRAALVIFGQTPSTPAAGIDEESGQTLPPANGSSNKASGWMKKFGISQDQLENLFAIDGDSVEIIATTMPGTSLRQKSVESYVIAGLASFLKTGDPAFTDKDARAVCSKVGCYDPSNHTNYMRAIGNLASGSKETGWKLSNPGLSRAAAIVKSLAQPPSA